MRDLALRLLAPLSAYALACLLIPSSGLTLRPAQLAAWFVAFAALPAVFLGRPERLPLYAPLSAALWLGVVPLWGLALDFSLGDCSEWREAFRPLAWPEALGVFLVYGAGCAALAVDARRPGPLPPLQELATCAALLAGALTCALLAAHFRESALAGLMLAVAMPLVAPWIAGTWLFWAFLARVRRRGADSALAPRVGPLAAGLVGLLALASAALSERYTGFIDPFWGAFARTCGGWALGALPTPPQPPDGHYLCTVAAQGHPWLVRPQRIGLRRGRPVVVNRQLAVANAFEDLLHERWPRLGRLARRAYDALAFDLSRHIRSRLAADALFLAMLPAQSLFLLALLLLDPGDPERRIDRMYRG